MNILAKGEPAQQIKPIDDLIVKTSGRQCLG
jgi:hypothetical protein